MTQLPYIRIPGATGVHHLGLTVPDLSSAVAFFTEVLGAEVLYRLGTVSDPDGSWMSDHLNVHEHAAVEIAMLRFGPTTNIELFEYRAPDQRRRHPRNSDWGGHHLAVWTEDFDASFAYLERQQGVVPLGESDVVDGGPIAGTRWIYFSTPVGLYLELVSAPTGLAYEEDTPARLFRPEKPETSAGKVP
ncbi:VOC family protein [Streptomyces sp. NPDC006995]|uniref:VOC family protein n=1 Tax=Streptomyces sp. NPDC006995 TaxID=3156907 RepID=UPI0033CD7ED7